MFGASCSIPFTGIAIILLPMIMGPADAAIGYDCDTKLPNKTISLIDSDDCDLAAEVETSTENIALLQLNEFGNATVLQCKIEIRRAIYNCGWQSNNLLVTHSTREYIHPISRKACEIAHGHGTMKMGDMIIDGLRVDAITTRNIMLAGSVDYTGACIGANYSDPYGTWNNVAVMGTVKITLQRRLAEVKVDYDTFFLPSGSQCKLSEEQCIDSDGGFTFRETLPLRFCNPNTYSILYKGSATKLTSDEETVYSVIVDDTTFSFITVGNEISCGATLLKTESPKLFIIERNDLKRLEEFNIIGTQTDTLDIFQYRKAKFIHVEMNIRSSARYLYRSVIEDKCMREKNILKNMLPIASTNPDMFAFQYMGGPGYTTVMEKYSLHIVQCVPVEVKSEQMEKCYNRLPILRGNQRLFMTLWTHIITKTATELPCDLSLRFAQYSDLEPTLHKVMPRPEGSPSISRLKPETTLTWKYEEIPDLATSGIYIQQQLYDWLHQQHPKTFNPAPGPSQIFPDANGYTPGVVYPMGMMVSTDVSNSQKTTNECWYRTWNMYSVIALVSVSVFSIVVTICIIKMIYNRQRRRRMESDHHDVTINL